jgi:hypothetical protein
MPFAANLPEFTAGLGAEHTATAVNLNTFEVHAVPASPITGIGPAARDANKPPVFPENVRKLLLQRRAHL